ncbi:MAG TPA: alpha/beta hydrolase [Candidatus Eisenbacteria bacterium]|nr:alpha/beta hydrolase [Candidatus Eisenbacteria bacterium]
MQVKGGRLELLVPHMVRGQVLRPGFVRMSLRLGVARQMPAWAKLQFTSHGVSAADLDHVLGRINGLESWADEWESLGRAREQGGRDALALGRPRDAAERYLEASAAYNFAQYVVFLDPARKLQLHRACVRAYAAAAPHFDPPAVPFDVPFRRRLARGYLRLPAGEGPHPVVVIFNGTNAVKEELHWWSEAFLARGLATVTFDGPGLGETFHRLGHVAEPRPLGVAILNHIESHPELDPEAVAYMGLSLGGYAALRMAAHDPRVRCVAAVSPPFSADVYWNVTFYALRRELAALYHMRVEEMDRYVPRITLEHALPDLKCPLMLAGGGHDMITPGEEAQRIFAAAHCERELVYYPRGAHDCFNVLSDLRPRMTGWVARQLARHHAPVFARPRRATPPPREPAWIAAEAVDPDFADELRGEARPVEWRAVQETPAIGARFRWPWRVDRNIEVVTRIAAV